MSKLIFTCLTFALLKVACSQTKIAIKAGANFSTARVYQNDQKLDTKFNTGFGAGILFKVPFEGVLHFSPYLAYNRRGYTYNATTGDTSQYKNTIHYIDIVPSLSVDFPSGKNSFVISAGPYLSVAIAGTEKTTSGGITSSSKMKFSVSNNYGIFDLGVSASLGYHTKRFFIETAYQPGLTNINNNADADKRNIRNRMISLQLGYYIK